MNFEQTLKEFNDLVKHGQGLIEKLKQAKESAKELTEKDRGVLCKFMNPYQERIGILACFTNTKKPVAMGGEIFDKCRRLTPAEVAEITGYKVEE